MHRKTLSRRKALSLALAVTAVAATAVTGLQAGTPDTAAAAPDSLRWAPCPQKGDGPRLECATLDVPLDYREPEGRKLEIAVSRLPSKDPAKRRGVLFTNPGGPGIPGLGYPAVLGGAGLPKDVLDSYDVIGFDQRGVGRSAPVTCDMTPAQQKRGNLPPYAKSAADVAREAKHARTLARQCATSSTAWMLPHLTTANTARDMDRIRAALGEPKLSYLGHSYGTYLGAAYATMFPGRGDRMVLDSSLGPGGYDFAAFRLLARGMADRFPDFAAYVAARPRYGLGTTPQQVTAKYFDLAERLDAKPVGGINGTIFRGMTLDSLFSEDLMPKLAKDWQSLDEGRPTAPPATPAENFLAARFHVLCADAHWPTRIRDYQRTAAADRLRYPMLGGSTGSIGPCAYWPDKGIEPPLHISDRGPSNVLMLQNERDPGTPLSGAKRLRQALGDRARLVTADQGGHGVYPFGKNTCANNAATTYLTTGHRPPEDRAC
ncbi:alpha/beta hydrolase [Streptomyces boninensis]|uniref:alpha/beta hydrolase n=1 Tax=Streptomyces boninensis TaxID=2039455 RepID=UPI003B220766